MQFSQFKCKIIFKFARLKKEMKKISEKSMEAISKIACAVFGAYTADGGLVRNGDERLGAELVASPTGCLPALVWLFTEFAHDMGLKPEFGIPLNVEYEQDAAAYMGVALEGFSVEEGVSESMTLLVLTDFFRKEMVPESVVDLDLSDLIANFKIWYRENVFDVDGPAMDVEPE